MAARRGREGLSAADQAPEPKGRSKSNCRFGACRLHSAQLPSTSDRKSARGTPVHLSHGRAQQGLRHQEGPREHPSVVLPGRQDRHPRARTARASRPCSRSWPGIDKECTGEAWLAEGATVGYLAQEPELDPALNVFGNVMEGVAKKTAIIDRYNELMMNYSDETADEAAKLQDEMDRQNLWDLEQQVEMAMEALGCPPKECRRRPSCRAASAAAWRSASSCCASPTCCCSTSRPTISTPRRRRGWKSTCAPIRAR